MLRVRSSDLSWLHSPQSVEIAQRKRDDEHVVVFLGSTKKRGGRIGLGCATVIARKHCGDLGGGCCTVVYDEDMTVISCIGRRLAVQQSHAGSGDTDGTHVQLVGQLLQ